MRHKKEEGIMGRREEEREEGSGERESRGKREEREEGGEEFKREGGGGKRTVVRTCKSTALRETAATKPRMCPMRLGQGPIVR